MEGEAGQRNNTLISQRIPLLQVLLPIHRAPIRLLVLGAHSDDIEIGCGGTVLRLLGESGEAEVRWVVFSAHGVRAKEAEESARSFLKEARNREVVLKSFRDGFFPYDGGEIKAIFEQMKGTFEPDLILTHFRHDLHQDHRLISELTWNTYRNHAILEYEVIKYDGDLGSPNFFVYLDEKTCQRKITVLEECFASQRNRRWFAPETFLSLMRIRGVESNSPSNYAEGFYFRKMAY